MRPADKHLTPQELDLLLLNPADSRDSNAPGALPPEAQQHLNGCMYCQSVAEKCRNAEEALRNLRSWGKTSGGGKALAPGSECPPEDIWSTLAAGLMKDEESEPFITHAATCGWCGPRLKEAMHDLAQDITAEEQEALDKLPSASPGWQRAMAEKMASASGNADVKVEKTVISKAKAGFGWWPKLVWASAGLAVAIVAVLVGIRLTREPDVNQLLAQAYTEQRTIELRMPGAKYGPMRVERAARPNDLPANFYIAQGEIKTELEKHPEEPRLLQAQARAHLLVWDYDKANQEIDQALELTPNNTGLLLDKATALYEKALESSDQREFNEALDLLGRVLKEHPDDAIALFNRAILDEHAGAYRQAVDDWDHYLRAWPNDTWTQEAKERRDQVKKKISEHQSKVTAALVAPSEFSRQLDEERKSDENLIRKRIEDYQQLALENWTVLAFDANNDASARQEDLVALNNLANELSLHHGDEWFHELLRNPDSPYFAAGLRSLAKAMHAAESNRADLAENESAAAMDNFGRADNPAGFTRAAEERIYALQMQLKYQPCLLESAKWIKEIAGRRYGWLEAQLELEQAICDNGAQEFKRSQWHASRALSLARSHSFPTLELRILGTDAFNLYDRGLERDGLKETQTGLRQYWESASPPLRGFQFYWNLFTAAEAKAQWQAAIVYGKEAVSEVALTQSKKSEAAARSRLASAASKAGDLALARTEAKQAEEIISQNNVDASDPYLVDLRIARAEVELNTGHPAEARELLKEVSSHLQQLEHYAILLHYYTVLGRVAIREADLAESETALAKAVEVGKVSAQKLVSDDDRVAWERATGPAYRAAVELRMVRGQYAEALSLWEEYRSLALWAASSETETGTLPEGTTAVVWALLPDGLATWVKSGPDLYVEWRSVDQTQLQLLSVRFARLCAASTSSQTQISSVARKLYEILINPVSGHLNDGSLLVIEADGFLASIPFEALQTETGRFVADLHPTAYTPLLRHFTNSPQLVGTALVNRNSKALLVSANAAPASKRPAIYNAAHEADAMLSEFAHHTSISSHPGILQQLRRELPLADVFGFVGHSADINRQTGLFLWGGNTGDAEVLGPKDISNSRLHLKLAVFSACSTGNSSEDELINTSVLVKSFLSANTAAVLATKWNLDSETAASYTHTFYSHLVSGHDVFRSAWEAAKEVRDHREYSHPYYWTAFSIFA